MYNSAVVSGGNHICPVSQSRLEKKLELYLLVAHDVWIWRNTTAVAIEHVINDTLAILGLEIVQFERDAKLHRYPLCILVVFLLRTFHPRQVLTPVFHVNTRNVIALLDE